MSATWSATCFEFEWSSLNIYFTWPCLAFIASMSGGRGAGEGQELGESVIVLLMAPGLLYTGHYFTTQESACANFRQLFSRFMFPIWSEIKSVTRVPMYTMAFPWLH